MDTALKRLANRLERLGMVTAPFRDHLAVRLPLLCHVRVRIAGGRLSCEPHTGAVTRTRGSVLVFLIFTLILSSTFRHDGITAEALTIGFLAVMAVAWETIRYVLTEQCITRIQAVVLAEPGLLDEPAPSGASMDAATPSSGSRPALGTGVDAAAEVRQRAGERVQKP